MRLLFKITVIVALLAAPVAAYLVSTCSNGAFGSLSDDDSVLVPIWRGRGQVERELRGAPERPYYLLRRDGRPDGTYVTYLEIPAPRFWLIALNRLTNREDENSCFQMAQRGN